jgi:hypothetical protein
MSIKAAIALGLLAAGNMYPLAAQGRRGDQDDVYQGRREGSLMSLRAIENGIVPQMKARGADYIGAEFDGALSRYRLKFMRGGSVIWIDVDGRTGAVLARAGD